MVELCERRREKERERVCVRECLCERDERGAKRERKRNFLLRTNKKVVLSHFTP